MNLYDYEYLIKESTKKKKINLYGSTICFTGKCRFTRDDLETFAYDQSAISKSTVNEALRYLVVPNDINSVKDNSKYIKARELEIEIITEDEFLKAAKII